MKLPLMLSVLGCFASPLAFADNYVTCSAVLDAQQIRACTDLIPLRRCSAGSARISQGTRWMNEDNAVAATRVFVKADDDLGPSICEQYFTQTAAQDSCCGG